MGSNTSRPGDAQPAPINNRTPPATSSLDHTTTERDKKGPFDDPPTGKEPFNLNSPPGAPMPNALPSSDNISLALPTTRDQPYSTLQTAQISHDPQTGQYPPFVLNSMLVVAITCPIIALVPPRRVDLSTMGLATCSLMATGFYLEQTTGKGLVWRIGAMIPSQANRDRKERERLAKAKERAQEARRAGDVKQESKILQMVREREAKMEEAKRKERERRGVVKKAWMRGEPEDWVERRRKKEEEYLADGRGYKGLIVDQIKEVVGLGGADDDDDDDDDDDNLEDKSVQKKP